MGNTNEIAEKVRFFFKRIRWKNILTFSFFLILASIFWLMQVYRQKFETTIVIPIKYVNVPDSIIFNTDLPTSFSVRIKDDGASLMRYNISKVKDSLEIDIRKRVGAHGQQIVEGQALEELVRTKLFSSTELITFAPTQIDYMHETMRRKKLAVMYNGNLDIPPGYILDGELTLSPDSVYAYGSQSHLDTIRFAHTVYDTTYLAKSTGKIKINIERQQGIRFIPASVSLDVPIDEFTQKEIEIPVECINLPAGLNIKFFPSSVKIPFYVGIGRYDDIHEGDFQVIVDYSQLNTVEKRLSSIPVRITNSPDYIRVKLPIPSEVEFLLEQK